MHFLLKYIRILVYVFGLVLAVVVHIYVTQTYATSTLQNIRLVQVYGFTAAIFLYLALLVSPLYAVFPSLPLRALTARARQALGVNAFFFALLHSSTAFFGLLQGFAGLAFLSNAFLLAIIFSFTALLILAILAATSLPFIVRKMGRAWKILHRLIYLAALLIVIHAAMIGTHFSDLSNPLPQLFLYAVFFLLILEARRLDKLYTPRFGVFFVMSIFVLSIFSFYIFLPQNIFPQLNIHAEHKVQSDTEYNVSFNAPKNITPGKSATLGFNVYDARTGAAILKFEKINEEFMHLVIVDNELKFFEHLHPQRVGAEFSIRTRFPKNDLYHLYLRFQPSGEKEQEFVFTLPVGTFSLKNPDLTPSNSTKKEGDYTISLATTNNALTFSMPINDLQPYLGTLAHLVMINAQTYEYLHIHPNGDSLTFYTPTALKGTYRVWLEFKHHNKIITTDFTLVL